MTEISAGLVKELRELTGAGMMDCKRALQDTEGDLDAARTLAERDAIRVTLTRVGRNVTHAARELGISRMTLYRLMDKHGIAPGPG